ncbi:MAG: 3'(2'),5'-bisphosphate nucleotidase CysQ [Oceanicaulis sp.]|uniref:inositol monophosphatase family protein n=1 Tax=Glycocaulis sp. TaxID=1969725 RepID=UPI0025C57663|nr:3'(2'),5'-bisphosphate nucleotidase CysQ [Glycocaulis sp.]MCC5981675.1 3'(2'),5'-bisphosphate nucleotidase CysQ [Oceanicaulis sp.]MCH8520509.1 3'(2'),5'-bisphosphate nucleotidase CysQ [Glycocaulis sp.]
MADADTDLDLLASAALEAGTIAMAFFRQGKRLNAWEKAPGDPVSEADLALDRFLKDALTGARPDYGWLSEESAEEGHDAARRFIVDPIDGTRAFVKGRADFCISLAVVENGMPLAAALYAPVDEALYTATPGRGAQRNGETLHVTAASTIAGARLMGDAGRLVDLRHLGAQTIHVNSVALRLALTAAGEADGIVAVRPKKDWDLAAGHLILSEAGGLITGHKGEALRYDGPDARQPPPVAAGPALHALLLEQLAENGDESR